MPVRDVQIRVTGHTHVIDTVRLYQRGAKKFTNTNILMRSDRAYAYGIETGRHRGGRLARAAGGAYYMRAGLNRMRPLIKPAIVRGLPKGEAGVGDELGKIQKEGESTARSVVPKRSRELEKSIRATLVFGSEGGAAGASPRMRLV